MRRMTLAFMATAFTLAGIHSAWASDPPVAGNLQGLELAQQTDAHPAVFVGVFQGTVDGKLAFGTWATGVHHETPLPDATGQSIALTGGQWGMRVWVLRGFWLRRVFLGGEITGRLTFEETDMFSVNGEMTITDGGVGPIEFELRLDHTVFPPAVSGALSQP